MKDSQIYYSIGALLYCPANNESIVKSITQERFGNKYSMALCLEDTISDNHVEEAEDILAASLNKIYESKSIKKFYIPKKRFIFAVEIGPGRYPEELKK